MIRIFLMAAVLLPTATACNIFIGSPPDEEAEAREKLTEADELRKAGRYEEAIDLYLQARRAHPRAARIYYNLFLCHRALNDGQADPAWLEQGVQVCGTNPIVAIPLARYYARTGRREEARVLYDRLLPRHPELREEYGALFRNE